MTCAEYSFWEGLHRVTFLSTYTCLPLLALHSSDHLLLAVPLTAISNIPLSCSFRARCCVSLVLTKCGDLKRQHPELVVGGVTLAVALPSAIGELLVTKPAKRKRFLFCFA